MFDDAIILDVQCRMCGTWHSLTVSESDYYAWLDGEYVQNAFPYLSPDERELLISHTCANCWASLFPPEEEEEEEGWTEFEPGKFSYNELAANP